MTTQTETTETTTQMDINTFLKKQGVNYTYCMVTTRNGKKHTINYKNDKNYPSNMKHSWCMYNKEECKKHNKFISKNVKEVTTLNALPSQSGFIVIDFDSKDELVKAMKNGFPIDAYHTKSISKNLPHYWIKLTDEEPVKDWLGHQQDESRELDLRCDNSFEKHNGKIFGDFLGEMSIEDVCKVLDIDKKTINKGETFNERREKSMSKSIVKKKLIKVGKVRNKVSVKTKEENVPFQYHKQKYNGELDGVSRKNIGMEIIDFETLKKLVENLDKHKMSNYGDWFALVCCIANMVKTDSDPYKYLDLIISFCSTMVKVDGGYYDTVDDKNEIIALFTKIFLDCDLFRPEEKKGGGTLWHYLHLQNFKVWKTLAFNKNRPIDPYEFRELEMNDALKAFNQNHTVIKGEAGIEIIEWDNEMLTYKNLSHTSLTDSYGNLRYKVKNTYTDKDEDGILKWKKLLDDEDINYSLYFDENGELNLPQINEDGVSLKILRAFKSVEAYNKAEILPNCKKVKNITYKPFIKEWFDWEGRNQYERDGFYPKKTCPYKTFNLFQGYDVEKIEDFDHIVKDYSKEKLEEELKFILQHFKYIMGNDKTDELYEYFLKYMAHIIKFPSIMPRVNWYIHGQEGGGKNQLLNLFENMLGGAYCISTTNANNLFGQFNAMLNHKILVNLNEIDQLHKFIENIKSVGTDKEINTTKKGKETKKYKNYTRLFFFGNNPNKMMIGFSDRRWIVCEGEVKQRKIDGYMEELAKQVSSIYIQKCLHRYLVEFVDVDKYYQFEHNRPLTQSYYNVKNRHIPYIHKFLKEMYEMDCLFKKPTSDKVVTSEKATMSELYQCYKQFSTDNNENNIVPKQVFGNDLEKYIIDPAQQNNEAYLEGYTDKIMSKIGRPTYDRNYYLVDYNRMNGFIKHYNYEWENPHELFLPESDNEEFETDDEEDE